MTDGSWQVADAYLAERSRVDPQVAVLLGEQPAVLLPDLSPDGFAARHEVDVRARRRLGAEPADLLGEVLADWLDGQIALADSGFVATLAAPLATPIHQLRQVFDDLPRRTVQDWEQIGRHLEAVARGYRAYPSTLLHAVDQGHTVTASQLLGLARQVRSWVARPGPDLYRALVGPAPTPLSAGLERAAEVATQAALDFAATLERDVLPRAVDRVGVGPELYAVTSRAFLGARTDPRELYAFGWSALAQARDRYRQLGRRLTGQDSIAGIRAALDADPAGRVPVGDPLLTWLQERLDRSTRHLVDGGHFGLPAGTLPVQARLEVAESGVMYYAPGDAGRTRPGRVMWVVPTGTTHVATWREVSTVHHEGLPGHHLQFAVTAGLDGLHPWQRHLCASHGYAEGWAHYAEGLADELGLVETDAERLGVLDAQAWRLARIVIDIGLHHGWPIPADQDVVDATTWDPGSARRALVEVSGMHPQMARFEVDRYLGWPGQALAFSVGARLWRSARKAAERRAGPGFDLADFHRTALGLGPMGLDLLARTLSRAQP